MKCPGAIGQDILDFCERELVTLGRLWDAVNADTLVMQMASGPFNSKDLHSLHLLYMIIILVISSIIQPLLSCYA